MLEGITQQEWERMSTTEQSRWWLDHIYRPTPQLTARAIVTGALLGATIGLTNIYVGFKTGWALGIGIVTAVTAFALFRFLQQIKLANRLTMNESITMQSIAVMAGYMTSPLFSSLAAYTLITHKMIPLWQAMTWDAAIAVLGGFMAFFLKRTYVNSNPWKYPFPEGVGVATVIREMHASDEGGAEERKKQLYKVYLLIGSTVLAVFTMLFKSAGTLARLSRHLVRFAIPEYLDRALFKLLGLQPAIGGFTLKQLAIGFETDIVLAAAGMFTSLRSSASMMIAAVVNYFIIAPILMHQGIIDPNGGFRAIAGWSVWLGGSIMFGAAVVSFFGTVCTRENVRSIVANFKAVGTKVFDPIAHLEVPAWASVPGILVSGIIVSFLTWKFFGTPFTTNLLTITLLIFLSILAVHATAETGTTPGSTVSKITQLTLSFAAPGQAIQNLMAAGMVSESSLSAAQLCVDLRPGHMLGANARQQTVAHFIGIIVGACSLIPVWYWLVGNHTELIGSDKFPVPAAKTWKAVAEALAGGFNTLHPSARLALVIGLGIGIVLETLYLVRLRAQRQWDATQTRATTSAHELVWPELKPVGPRPWGLPISTIGLGFGFVLQFTNSFVMFLGSLVGALLKWRFDSRYNTEVAAAKERDIQIVAGGIMAGGSIMGIVTALAE